MTKRSKNIIALAIGLTGVYFIIRYFSKKPEIVAPQIPNQKGGTTAAPAARPVSALPLKKGSKGQAVEAMQRLMLSIDSTLLPKFGADGDFGSETEAALKKLIGKGSIDSKADIDALNALYNKKYQFVLNKPAGAGVPLYDPFGFVKK